MIRNIFRTIAILVVLTVVFMLAVRFGFLDSTMTVGDIANKVDITWQALKQTPEFNSVMTLWDKVVMWIKLL
jgi:hypothetical protein